MKKGEVTAYRRGNSYMALAWRDKRQVTMLSSAHNASTKEVTRKIAGGKTLTLKKPVVICDYTENMGAVDRADHYCASYAFSRKSMKWWRKLFFLASGSFDSEQLHFDETAAPEAGRERAATPPVPEEPDRAADW